MLFIYITKYQIVDLALIMLTAVTQPNHYNRSVAVYFNNWTYFQCIYFIAYEPHVKMPFDKLNNDFLYRTCVVQIY